MARLDTYFRAMHQQGASDLHLVAGNLPAMRLHGELKKLKAEELTDNGLRELLRELPPAEAWQRFEETGDLDFGYEVEGLARFRANYFMQKNGAAAVFRLIPADILNCEQLGLPEVVRNLAKLHKGLVLVTGPTGSGKSTTLAAIIDEANRVRRDNIITVEDPIEFVHQSQGCLVSHREVGKHTRSFASALRAALREDPDIILVGEMRDKETVGLAIEAAATGHLVFGTLHTQNAPKTVDRIIEVFTAEEQPQIRSTLADSLKAVVAQNLFRRVDKSGRVAALEIMVVTPAISNLIREAKTYQIPSAMQTGKKHGMQSLETAIIQLLDAKMIDPKEAYEKSVNKEQIVRFLPEPPPEVGR
ncbi:MAG: type IV pilus twitching motility protein PilT [Deferrisomatales bacterium]|nr:type IV pilus twitching motility protein PilT [Deferrisomatales bacterium]